MSTATSYPGVYIEEIASGVHTITGVATSITAFIGYTPRGPVDEAVHLFSFPDFERAFGGLAVDSPLSYSVRQYFQNGGTEAYVVRVAKNAHRAGTTICLGVTGGAPSLRIDAVSAGTWGNNLRVSVDYNTLNPASLFNLTVLELIDQNGLLVPGRSEVFRNLSMNNTSPTDAEVIINAGSDLVRATRLATIPNVADSVTGNVLTAASLDPILGMARGRVAYMINGQGPFEFNAHTAAAPLFTAADSLDARLNKIGAAVLADVTARGFAMLPPAHSNGTFFVTFSLAADEHAAINFLPASSDDITHFFAMGLSNGGRETDGAAGMRPAQSGTVSGALGAPPDLLNPALTGTATGTIQVDIMRGTIGSMASFPLPLWGAGSGPPVVATPTTVQGVLDAIVGAITHESRLSGTAVAVVDGRIVIQAPPGAEPNVWYRFSNAGPDTTADEINLIAANAQENLAYYAPGSGAITMAQLGLTPGDNGTFPSGLEFRGSQVTKTGMYALENVDLFNILCLPDVSDPTVLSEAIAYCTRRRAFMIIDPPNGAKTLAQAQAWLNANANLRSRNTAAYFPRIRAPDPLRNSIVTSFTNCGAMAGVYARTDAERGVWKAPAGTNATIIGAVGLDVTLTDPENGVLNPLGLNVLRTFPVYGTVSWGARTLRGADALADEYKYIPVRRLALFLEESLYRGTQWAVFEPNDEPLWAQIRLNLGAFMHFLFAQGAFQGRTLREAYFVKCDSETTTQNDIDLGRVNIVVGFAPLKPAEFVIIKIQQIAGAILT